MKEYTFHDLVNLTMTGEERFCLASEVDAVLKSQAVAAISGMNAAKAISSGQLREAARLRADSSPDTLESERIANAILTAENERLKDRLIQHELAVMRAYGLLWLVQTDNKRIHIARRALLDLLSKDQQRLGIEAAQQSSTSIGGQP